MLTQIQIHPNPSVSHKEKGDFFELLLRTVMEGQRYKVTQQINFTGTEIDLLCEHMDRPNDHVLVECKARASIVSADIKSFVYDVLVVKRAEHGFFVHTSELQHQAAGMVEELKKEHGKNLIFWGPNKIIELLQHSHLIQGPPGLLGTPNILPTKRILLYSHLGHYWLTILTNKIVPTHFHIADACDVGRPMNAEALKWIEGFDEVKGLSRLDYAKLPLLPRPSFTFDAVAEIQEALKWEDYHLPVGAKFFVGRRDIRHRLFQFIQSPIGASTGRRVFFVEGKSGWGKSSVVAELRARARNIHNRRNMYVLALDSRTANTGEFVSLAIAKLVASAAKNGFVPSQFSEINIPSSFDTLQSPQMQELCEWLNENKRVIVLVFDQFEDVFRKEDLFRTFHKLMMDVHELQGPFFIGFSWKSEIYIPIDNPAYNLWQQARNLAEVFQMEEFLGSEVDRVLKQLETFSGHQLPADLRRRLKDLQRFPWLTKKLSIHCYQQMKKGIPPEELVDQNLNVDVLFQDDTEELTPEEMRALRIIARRGYDGDPFDVSEIDDATQAIQQREVNSLLGKRLVIRSGAKYNVYWDIFRDFLIEGKPPILAESFLLRQFPNPCLATLNYLIQNAPCTIDELLKHATVNSPQKKGTVLNVVRELRYLGVATQVGSNYQIRPSIRTANDFKVYITDRLNAHIVVRSLSKLQKDTIMHEDVENALRDNFRGYSFSKKTWATYASYLIGWLRYADISFGGRLSDAVLRSRTGGIRNFTPQLRPENDIEVLLLFSQGTVNRSKRINKALYDLKALDIVTYSGNEVAITKRGRNLLQLDPMILRKEFARLALEQPKIRLAYEAALRNKQGSYKKFDSELEEILGPEFSESYRKVTKNIFKAWAKFILEQSQEGTQSTDLFTYAEAE